MGEAKAKKEAAKKEGTKKSALKNNKDMKKVGKKEVAKEAVKKAPVVKKDKTSTGTSLKKFFKGAIAELKKVYWPSRQQLIAFTMVVVVSVLAVAAAIWVVDSGLTQLVKLVLKK